MTIFDWMDRHWFIAGWCSIILCAGVASILHSIRRRISGQPVFTNRSNTEDTNR